MSTILVIEDQSDINENISELLQLNNFNVVSASNGNSGIQLALEVLPDLILCDIGMPEMDGYEVNLKLQSNSKTKSIPIIFVTAFAEKSEVRRARELGIRDYLIKPFEEVELIRTVKKVLYE